LIADGDERKLAAIASCAVRYRSDAR